MVFQVLGVARQRVENVVMKLDNWKSARDLALYSDPHRHFAFNCERGMVREGDG